MGPSRSRPARQTLASLLKRAAPRLRLNDEVFRHPTEANVKELQRKYGVDWLFADRAQRPDGRRLGEIADLKYRTRRYLVFRMPDSR